MVPLRQPGRLLDANEVANELFSGKVTPRWVRDRLRAGRVKLDGHKVVWEENAVRAWIANKVEVA